MPLKLPESSALYRAAATGLGAAVSGPLCASVGSWIGGALLGAAAGKVIAEGAEKLGKTVGEKLLESYFDSYGSEAPPADLEAIYCEALRLSLAEMPKLVKDAYPEWFSDWDRCLTAGEPLDLKAVGSGDLSPELIDGMFRRTLERLAAQGAALGSNTLSLRLQSQTMPETLWRELTQSLEEPLGRHFLAVVIQDKYSAGWKELQGVLRRFEWSFLQELGSDVRRIKTDTHQIPEIGSDVKQILAMLEPYRKAQENDRKLQDAQRRLQEEQQKSAELMRLVEEYRKLQASVGERASRPSIEKTDKALQVALAAKNLDDAVAIKTRQVREHRAASERLPQDLFELGQIHEMRFEWDHALDAYRNAWEGERCFRFGFKLANLEQEHLLLSEAIHTYLEVLPLALNQDERASILHNLAIVYRNTHQIHRAEKFFSEALEKFRDLAQENPAVYLPHMAKTLNNLANLYRDTQRMREAEEAYYDALRIRHDLADTNSAAYLLDLANTFNDFANFYCVTQRIDNAKDAYVEALRIYRDLSRGELATFQPHIATTLNNLALLYQNLEQMDEAEEAYGKALSIRSFLTETNPRAYLPYVADTLHNMATFYCATRRFEKAEDTYAEALRIRRDVAEENPTAYLPHLAATLNSRAILYLSTQRQREAWLSCTEARNILAPFFQRNPALHGDQMARIALVHVSLLENDGAPVDDICATAQQGFRAAQAPDLKEAMALYMQLYCGILKKN